MTRRPVPRLVLRAEELRLISAGAPPQTQGSDAESCQTSRFNCCAIE